MKRTNAHDEDKCTLLWEITYQKEGLNCVITHRFSLFLI